MELFKPVLARLVYDSRLALVPGALQPSWPQRMFLKRLLNDLAVDCVFDVGANMGQYGHELRRIGYTGKIISFEPDPQAYERLAARAAGDDNWTPVNLALGRDDGSAEFNIMNVSLFNSFRQPTTREADTFAGANEVARKTTVRIARLDSLFAGLRKKHGFSRVFLKMDTQGFDGEVFAGASNVHDDILAFQSELPVRRIYEDVLPWHEQVSIYEQHGFSLSGIFAVNPNRDDLIEFDCFFTRR